MMMMTTMAYGRPTTLFLLHRFIFNGFILLLFLSISVETAGLFEVNIFKLFNKCGRLANGNVCTNSPLASNDSVLCPGLCNVIGVLCLQPFGDSLLADVEANSFKADSSWCPYGNGSTSGVLGHGHNNFDFDHSSSAGLITVPFTFSWIGSVTVILDLKHRDFATGKDHVITRSVKRLKINAEKQADWTVVEETFNVPKTVNEVINVAYGYRVVCKKGYYGSQCNKTCTPRDDEKGHFLCDDDGNRRCLNGWSDESKSCVQPICSPDCKGHCRTPGTCDKCLFGWTGPNCDQCVRYTGCEHGYCNKPFECLCEPRWGGLQCNIDMDYCFHKSPCKNGATCIPHEPNNYTCICDSGYAGRDCEFELNPCWSNPCLNFGTCVVATKNTYQCLCDQLHNGARCENLLPGKGDTDPCFYDGQVFGHGSRWDTNDCRQCVCMDGYSNCSQSCCDDIESCKEESKGYVLILITRFAVNRQSPMCNHGDCLSPYGYTTSTNRCPHNQYCQPIKPNLWNCLKWPCSQETFGQCLPVEFIDGTGVSNRQKCDIEKPPSNDHHYSMKSTRNKVEDELEFCSRFYMTLRQDLIPLGAYPENICYHILLLLFKQQLTQYNVFCSLNRPNLTLIVDIVSVRERWTVNGLKPALMETIRLNSSSSPYLKAVSSIYSDSSTADGNADEARKNAESGIPENKNFNWLLIYLLPVVITLTLILSIIVLVLKHRNYGRNINNSTNGKSLDNIDDTVKHLDIHHIQPNNNFHSNNNINNTNTNNNNNNKDYEMKWNNLGSSCTSIFSNTIFCKSSSSKKECNLYRSSGGIGHSSSEPTETSNVLFSSKKQFDSGSIDGDLPYYKNGKDYYVTEATV